MGKNLDISHIVTSYELDDFDYEEFSDNERVTAIHNRWGFISEVKKQQSASEAKSVKTEEKV